MLDYNVRVLTQVLVTMQPAFRRVITVMMGKKTTNHIHWKTFA